MTEAEFVAEMRFALGRALLNPEPVAHNQAGWKILGDACNAELVKMGYATMDEKGNITITPEGQAWADRAFAWGLGIDAPQNAGD